MKKFLSLTLALCIILSLCAVPAFAAGETATKTASKVTVDGTVKAFDAYTINGNNYFKLRDIAYILSGTSKQFEVTWDGAKNAINLVSDKPYTAVGGEMAIADGATTKSATANTSKIYLNGAEVALTAYTINSNNYFKLRDLGVTFDFGVEWDGANNTVAIKSTTGYVPETNVPKTEGNVLHYYCELPPSGAPGSEMTGGLIKIILLDSGQIIYSIGEFAAGPSNNQFMNYGSIRNESFGTNMSFNDRYYHMYDPGITVWANGTFNVSINGSQLYYNVEFKDGTKRSWILTQTTKKELFDTIGEEAYNTLTDIYRSY